MIPSFSRWRRRLDAGRKDERAGSLFSCANSKVRVGEDRPQWVRMAMNEASRLGEFLARYAPSGRYLILSEKLYRAMPPPAQYGDA